MRFHLMLPWGAVLITALVLDAPKDRVFNGEIMDPQCAMDGTHAEMLKKVGLAGKDPKDPEAKKTCSEICIQMGGKYVLYDAASQKTYQLDDQSKVKQFAGQNVKVSGTLDKSGAKIHVTNVEPFSQ